ncbi:MAG: hypothetical protein RI897_3764 [Verrucomicrobiota bacterium]
MDFAEVFLGGQRSGVVWGWVLEEDFLVGDLEVPIGAELALEEVELEGVFSGEEVAGLLDLAGGALGAAEAGEELGGEEAGVGMGRELEDGVVGEVDLDEGGEGEEQGLIARRQVGG